MEQQSVAQSLDWTTPDIEWHGHGGDRGLRGIAFDKETVYVAAGDRLLAFSPDLKALDSWQNPYLKHCQDLAVWERTLYVMSAAYDSVLGFNLDDRQFQWALHVQSARHQFGGSVFDPLSSDGPLRIEKLQLNSLCCNEDGMYITGLKTGGMLHFNGEIINMAAELPANAYNAMPFRDGVLFNDNANSVLRYTGRGDGEEDRAMAIPVYDLSSLEHVEAIDDGVARPGFARGLCVLTGRLVAGGCTPSTVSLYDLAANKTLGSVRLSNDVRSAIHSIGLWPFD